jgi:putative membrane protein
MRNLTRIGAILAVIAFAAGAASARAATRSTLYRADTHILNEAIMGNQSEVMLGHLALERASSSDVKAFAQHMINDHSTAANKYVRVAARKHVLPPKSVGAETLATYKRLSKLSGDAFDRAYVQDMVKDHEKDVSGFKTATRTLKDPDLLKLTKATLPALEQHLTMIRQISAHMGG